jgi:hypothetical protein
MLHVLPLFLNAIITKTSKLTLPYKQSTPESMPLFLIGLYQHNLSFYIVKYITNTLYKIIQPDFENYCYI